MQETFVSEVTEHSLVTEVTLETIVDDVTQTASVSEVTSASILPASETEEYNSARSSSKKRRISATSCENLSEESLTRSYQERKKLRKSLKIKKGKKISVICMKYNSYKFQYGFSKAHHFQAYLKC